MSKAVRGGTSHGLIGALLGLVLLVSRPVSRADAAHLALTPRALHGFGTIGTVLVGAIVVTSLANSWLLVGPVHIAQLGATLYGRLLLAKLALFAAMLALAGLNRFRFTPALNRSIATANSRAAWTLLRVVSRLKPPVPSSCSGWSHGWVRSNYPTRL